MNIHRICTFRRMQNRNADNELLPLDSEKNHTIGKLYSLPDDGLIYEYDDMIDFIYHQAQINGNLKYVNIAEKFDGKILLRTKKVIKEDIINLFGFVIT